jgi:hypothetical protein
MKPMYEGLIKIGGRNVINDRGGIVFEHDSMYIVQQDTLMSQNQGEGVYRIKRFEYIPQLSSRKSRSKPLGMKAYGRLESHHKYATRTLMQTLWKTQKEQMTLYEGTWTIIHR